MATNRRTVLQQLTAAAVMASLPQPTHADDGRKQRIKIGQIGVGHAHADKLSVYRASPDYEVVGIVEPNEELRKRAESRTTFQGLTWLTIEQLLNVEGLQAVLVETEVRNLLNTADVCIAAGKHVHLDKPAGTSLTQYTQLLEAARRQSLLVQMGYMYRYSPAVQLLRTFLERGWLGEIFEVHTVMSKVVDPATRRQLAEYPGGMMFELGCHILDLVIGVLGRPQEVNSFAQHAAANDDTLVDNMLAVLTYPKAIASIKTSAQEVGGFARRHLVVCGTLGTFQIQPLDSPQVQLTLSTRTDNYPAGAQQITFPGFPRYVADAADMARIIRGEKSSDFPYEHDLTVQTTLFQACGFPTS